MIQVGEHTTHGAPAGVSWPVKQPYHLWILSESQLLFLPATHINLITKWHQQIGHEQIGGLIAQSDQGFVMAHPPAFAPCQYQTCDHRCSFGL
jgi:hypothetical protein